MERWNAEGIPKQQLVWALSRRDIVMEHRRIDRCLLCRRPKVNEAALCEVCYGTLNNDELALALRWMSGAGP